MVEDTDFQTFSTSSLPRAQRLETWMNVLDDSMWRVTDWRDIPRDFNVELTSARLGPLTTLNESISRHHSRRTGTDLERSSERSCHLFVSV